MFSGSAHLPLLGHCFFLLQSSLAHSAQAWTSGTSCSSLVGQELGDLSRHARCVKFSEGGQAVAGEEARRRVLAGQVPSLSELTLRVLYSPCRDTEGGVKA